MRVALDLDPLSVAIYWDIGNKLLAAKRYDEALRHLAKAKLPTHSMAFLANSPLRMDVAPKPGRSCSRWNSFSGGLCSALGDRTRLRLWLDRSYAERSTLFLDGP